MKINTVLALLAVTGGITAAFTNYSERNNLYPNWKFDSERIDGEKINYISASYLADMLYQKEPGIKILDARGESEFKKYHIPGAVLTDQEKWKDGGDKKAIFVICGVEGDPGLYEIPAKIEGRVYLLKGGIEEWYRMVLFPDFSAIRIPNSLRLEEILNRSLYFGGTPRNSQLLNIKQRENRYREGC